MRVVDVGEGEQWTLAGFDKLLNRFHCMEGFKSLYCYMRAAAMYNSKYRNQRYCCGIQES